MHAAVVSQWGQKPQYQEVADLPEARPDEVRVKVEAAGVHRVVRSRAAGQHYSSKTTPHTLGVDGVGTTPDGQKVYFVTFGTGGSFSEYVNVPKRSVTPLPAGLDPIQAAALANPALSSWMALKARTQGLPEGFTCLVVGATSASGRLAISLARALGAKRVVGAARNKDTLAALGLDDTVVIAENAVETDWSALGDVDVILDYVYGPPTVHLFNSLASTRPVQYVHIGSLAALDVSLPGSVLRSTNLTIRGSGPGSWSMREAIAELPSLFRAIATMEEQKVSVCQLKDIESEWDGEADGRLVFVP